MLCSRGYGTLEDVRRAGMNTARRLCCRDDERVVSTFWLLTINRLVQRPRVADRGKAAIAFFGCATMALEAATDRELGGSKWHPDAVIALLDRAQWNR